MLLLQLNKSLNKAASATRMSNRRQKRRHVKVTPAQEDKSDADGGGGVWSPPNWRQVYDNILEMRKGRDAPVDTMGCERAHDTEASPKVNALKPFFTATKFIRIVHVLCIGSRADVGDNATLAVMVNVFVITVVVAVAAAVHCC